MTRIRMMWYAGTVLTALAMLAASATAAAQPRRYAPRVRVATAADSSKAARWVADRDAKDADKRVKDADHRGQAASKKNKKQR